MKKIISILVIALLCSCAIPSSLNESSQTTYVWVCANSTTYHKTSSCLEVKNCANTSQKITLTAAKNQGKKPCGVCYPQQKTSSNDANSSATQSAKKQVKKTTKTQSSSTTTTEKKQVKKIQK